MIEAWDTGAYRDVREIWERAEILGGENKFKGELIRGLHALTGHLEYDIGQIRSAVSVLSALSCLEEKTRQHLHRSRSVSLRRQRPLSGIAGRRKITLAITLCCGKSINKEAPTAPTSATRIESKRTFGIAFIIHWTGPATHHLVEVLSNGE